MTRFQLSDGQDITGKAFEINGIAYSANWPRLASDGELAAAGVMKVESELATVDDTALPATLSKRQGKQASHPPRWRWRMQRFAASRDRCPSTPRPDRLR